MSKEHGITVSMNGVKSKFGEGHPQWDDRLESSDNWRWYNRQFQRTQTTARGLAVAIYRGFGFTPVYRNDWRKKANFEFADHIAFDFDTQDARSSLDTLVDDVFYSAYGSFCYSTPSSTPEKPKSRMVYIFEESITDIELYEDFYRAMLKIRYSAADQATKDAARLFFGSENCELRPQWELLPLDVVRGMVDVYHDVVEHEAMEKRDRRPVVSVSPSVGNKLFAKTLETMMNTLAHAPDGEKHSTLTKQAYALGGYVAGGYIAEADALQQLRNAIDKMSNVRDTEAAYKTAAECLESGKSEPLTVTVRADYKLDKVI